MKKFNVTVNGKTYAVEVEEVGAGQGGFTYQPVETPARVPSKPVEAPKVQNSAPKIETPAPAGGELMQAPMPGTILDIKVAEGQTVEKGQIVVILEAMKMENEIAALSSGVVSKIYVSKSSTVSAGDPLLTIS